MNELRRTKRFQRSIWAAILLVFGFLLCQQDTALAQVTGSGTINRIPKWTPSPTALSDSVITDLNGNIGIGAATPSALLNLRVLSGDVIERLSNAGSSGGELDLRYKYETSQHRIGFTDSNGTWLFYSQYASPNTGSVGYFPGNVGIGNTNPQVKLDVTGNINASGTIQGGNVIAKYQDVAEWVPASRAISAGTVVVLDAERSNHVLPSTSTYDTRVAGVVSARPGVLLGEGGEGKVMVATTGRVRVKVDATNAPIRVGDLLVTSDKEGFAMRSQPLDLGGTPIHRPGTLIGKALEPLEKGTGEILVLLSLQ
ncbi:MAG: peptidase G2 autoproteolytic cleavage domain-containing protein [Acidobacteriota bacterium]